ncbi:hypothetical protein BH11PLA2_BH11PLA2_50240 [soil metagenome]
MTVFAKEDRVDGRVGEVGDACVGGSSDNASEQVAFQASTRSVNYGGFGNDVLNVSGQVAFQASTSSGNYGIFAGTPGSPLTTAALVGTAAPAGGNYTALNNNPVLNASGQVAFRATTSVSGVGIFVGTPGSPFGRIPRRSTAGDGVPRPHRRWGNHRQDQRQVLPRHLARAPKAPSAAKN